MRTRRAGRRLVSVAVGLVLAGAIGALPVAATTAMPAAAATKPRPRPSYVALGDSYSSGEGNSPFLSGTDTSTDVCHRSGVAYPELLTRRYDLSLSFVACSGATTADVTRQRFNSEAPQIDDGALGPSTALVTLTIGGNDAGFAPVVTACIEQNLIINIADPLGLLSLLGGLLGLPGPDPSCADSSTFLALADSAVEAAGLNAEATFAAIRAKTAAPGASAGHASVIAAGYPELFPLSASAQACPALASLLTPADQRFFNSAVLQVNSVLRKAAAQAGINFVDPVSAFADHGVCGAGGAWINALAPDSGSFHPNAEGQEGYAGAFEAFVSAAKDRTPAGFPADPAPAVPQASALTPSAAPSETPAGELGNLDVQSLGAGGLLSSAHRVKVVGAGFAPGSKVSIHLVSPGLGASGDAILVSAKADSAGDVERVVSIPSGATGFLTGGSASGLAFLHALGTTEQGARLDDLAMANL